VDALRDSYKLFMKNKLEVLVFWVLLTLICLLIFLIALVPIAIILLPIILSAKTLSAAALIKSGMPLFLVADECGVLDDLIRIAKNNLLPYDKEYHGKCISKREYFYGFKIQVIATI
jgi:hypothetical protein